LGLLSVLGEVGVLFLLFSLGLEFSIKKLLDSARTIIKSGVIYLSIVGTSALVFAICMGWAVPEILLAFGIIIIASSAIVAKTLVDLKRTANPETEVVLGLMLFQDIFMAIFLPIVSAIALTHAGTPLDLVKSIGFAFLFIILFVAVSLKTSILEKLFSIASDEVFLLTIMGVLFFMAGTSAQLEISDAIGALILGMVLAETSHKERILHMIIPYRDFFGAVFFFGFGLSIELTVEMLAVSLPAALLAVGVVVMGSLVYGMVMSRVAGISKRGAVNVGMTIVSRGEFSIVLASMGVAAGLSDSLRSFAVLFVVLLAISGPLLSRFSGGIYRGLAKMFRWRIVPAKRRSRRQIDPKLFKEPPQEEPEEDVRARVKTEEPS
jgi:CPA2 family monovalent cation:H+ antiporter-2